MLTTIAEQALKILIEISPDIYKKFFNQKDNKSINDFGFLLTGRLVYLMRYLDQTGDVRYPESYGRVLMAYVEAGNTLPPANFSHQSEEAWRKTSKYACLYLSSIGLVAQYGAAGGEVTISDIGKKVLSSKTIKEKFKSAFEQPIQRY